LLVVVLACLVFAASATAGSAASVAGDYTVTGFGDTRCKDLTPGSQWCSTTGFVSEYTGDLVGTSTVSFEQVIDCARGKTYGYGTETFTGKVRGQDVGALRWRLVFSADFDCELGYPWSFRGLGVVVGSSRPGGMHGVLTFDDTSYRGTLLR
jgi:hypothetical protein